MSHPQNQWKLVLVSALLVGASACSASSNLGTSSGGGGGLAEKNVVFAYQNLGRYLDLCLALPSCRLNEAQANQLRSIRAGLGSELPAEKAFVFTSSGERPGFFLLDGAERLARTGGSVGDVIFVNRSLAYEKRSDGPRPLSLGNAVAMLVHELGHHYGIVSHEELDALGSKVEAHLAHFSIPVHGKMLQQNLELLLIYGGYDLDHPPMGSHFAVDGLTQVIVSDNDGIREITDELFSQIQCPQVSGPIASGRTAGRLSAQWLNVHFEGQNRHEVSNGKSLTIATLRGRFLGTCRDENNFPYVSVAGNPDFTVEFHLETKDQGAARTEDARSQAYRLKAVRVLDPSFVWAV